MVSQGAGTLEVEMGASVHGGARESLEHPESMTKRRLAAASLHPGPATHLA